MVNKIPNIRYRLAAFIALITFAVYLPALRNEFVHWDDSVYVFQNIHIRTVNAAFFKWILFDFYSANWHPLTWISHALDYAVWGLNPRGHHLTNIILHSANTFLVVLLTTRLLRLGKETNVKWGLPDFLKERAMLIGGCAAGLLFGLHPLHVESVAWVAERKDLLCALFFLLAVLAYIKYAAGSDRAIDEPARIKPLSQLFSNHYALSLVCFILALLSKPMAVTLPIVLLLLDWHPLSRIRSYKTFVSTLIEKIPFVALSFVSSIITVLAQKAGGAVAPIELLPLSRRCLTAADSLIRYLWKMIWPLDLVPFYPYPKNASIVSIRYLISIELLILITLACIVLVIVKKQKVWLTAWSYYIVTLLPVIGIIQVGNQAMADRYAYLPSLGPFLVAGLLAAWISKNLMTVKRWGYIMRLFVGACTIVIVSSIAYLTVHQIKIWRNSIIFWDYVIEHGGDKALVAYVNRGVALYEMGQFDKAIEDDNKVIALSPSYYKGYFNRGQAYEKKRMYAKSLDDFDTVIKLNSTSYDAYYRRGKLLENLGQNNKAIENYNHVISLDPSAAGAYFYLGLLYGRTGLLDKAIEYLSKAIDLNPGNADYYNVRGAFYSNSGHTTKALKDLNKAIELAPTTASAYYNRGVVFNQIDETALALADLRKACELGDNDGCNGLHSLTEGSNRK